MISNDSNPPQGTGGSDSKGPVGKGNYVVKQGDCIGNIAFNHGHFWKTIWNDPKNQQLKQERKNPNTLMAGDKVSVPDLRMKQEPGSTETRHRFKRKGVPSKLVVQICENGQVKANKPCVISVDGAISSGQTDNNGRLEVSIPPNAQKAMIRVKDGDEEQSYEIHLGHLDPWESITGVQQRLKNLGFYQGENDGRVNSETDSAIKKFQMYYNMEPTGKLNEQFKQQLKDIHGA